MKLKLLKDKAGLTLAEMMVTILIFSFLSAGLLIFTSMMQNMNSRQGVDVKLVNEARRALDKIIWGPRDAAAVRNGIWEAQTITLVSPTDLQYTDTSNVLHEVRLNGLKIESRAGNNAWTTLLDLNGATADSAGDNTLALTFLTPQPNLVEVRLVLGQRVRGRWENASLATKVFIRNL